MAYSDEQIRKGSLKAKEALKILADKNKGKSKSLAVTVDQFGNVLDDSYHLQLRPVLDLNEALSQFKDSWRKTSEALMSTCRLIQDFQQAENWREIEQRIFDSKIIPSIAWNQMKRISKNQVLMNQEYSHQLPRTMQMLYMISQVQEDYLEEAFMKNKIQANSELDVIKKITSEAPRKHTAYDKRNLEKHAQHVSFNIKVTITNDNWRSSSKEIIRSLSDQYEEFGYTFEFLDKSTKFIK